jgi:hypothetical protein
MSSVVLGDNNITINGKIMEIGNSIGLTPKIGANPIIKTIERMYPPIRNVSSENHQITGQSYGNGLYVISFSSFLSPDQPWNCFNTSNTVGGHWGSGNRYIVPNGNFSSTLTDNIVPGYTGDWLKIKFPVAINLTRYAFKIRPSTGQRAPQNFKIYGSNDEINWVEITHGTNPIYVNGLYDISISTSGTYNSFGLVVNKMIGDGSGSADALNFDEWFIYGTEILNKRINDDYSYIPFTYDPNVENSPVLQVDSTNLLAHYKFNGNLLDSSGNNRTLSQTGAITYNTSSQNAFPYSQYIDTTATAQTNFTTTPDINQNVPISFAFWFFVSGTGTYTMMGYGDYSLSSPSIQFDFGGGNQISIATALSNRWTFFATATGLSINTWYHCVYTLNNSSTVQTILYINGVSRHTGTGNANQTLGTSKHLVIGESGDKGRGFLGRIGDVRIYNKVLTPSEVLELYNLNEQSSYSITFPENTECDILIVGGGGAGGKRHGSGGGAGTLLYHKGQILNGTYNIKVGNGGLSNINNNLGINGNISTVGNFSEFKKNDNTKRYYANGGGVGTTSDIQAATTNGGQGFLNNSSLTLPLNNVFNGVTVSVVNKQYQNTLTFPEGCRGFIGGATNQNFKGNGGGGAGSGGQNHQAEGTVNNEGYGGDGLGVDITGVNVIYAGGGNGSDFNGIVAISRDGNKQTIESRGGGGFGSDNGNAENGKNGTGGGGGGQGNDLQFRPGNGGSGIVIIRYKIIKESYNAQWTYSSTNPNVYHMGNVGIGTTNPTSALSVIGSIDIDGPISALYKTFKIEHPLNINKWLYHGCVEGPRFDNIYRGKKITIDGKCEIDIDKECNTVGGMSEGTFDALNTSCQLYVMNNQTYDRVNGKIDSGKITINCENITDNIEIDWLVIGERKDEQITIVPYTNDVGKLICEHNM